MDDFVSCEHCGAGNDVNMELEVYLCRICCKESKLIPQEGTIAQQAAVIERLEAQLHEVREIYTGSDGFIPETAPEAYCLRVMEQMYQAALTEGET